MGNALIERLGWTLVHFVWEGALVAALLAALLRFSRRSSARLRYGLACAVLGCLALAPVATFWMLAPTESTPSAVIGTAAMRATSGERVFVGEPALQSLMPLLVGVWAVGVALLSARLVGTLLQVERWRRRHARPAGEDWQDRAKALARGLGIRRPIRVLISDRIGVPSAWGVMKAVIVLPTSLLAQLSPAQVETILMHELAHIRRHDYLVNLVQSVVETLLFYHPAVWWVSGVVRREREHCCDDVVVRRIGDPLPYARALLHLEERRLTLPHPTLSAKGSNLMNRIARILTPQPAPLRVSPLASSLAALGVLGAILGGTLQAQAQSKPVAKPKHVVKRAKAKRAHPAPKTTLFRVTTTKGGKAVFALPPAPRTAPPAPKPLLATIAMVPAVAPISVKAAIMAAPAFPPAPAKVSPDYSVYLETSRLKGTTVPAMGLRRVPAISDIPALGSLNRPGSAIGRPAPMVNAGPGVLPPSPAEGIAQATGGFGGGSTLGVAGFGGGGLGGQRGGGGFGGASGGLGGGGYGRAGMEEIHVEEGANGLVDVDVKDAGLGTVLRQLARASRLSIVIEAGDYRDVTMVLTDQPSPEAIGILCRAANATWRKEGNVYYVSPRGS